MPDMQTAIVEAGLKPARTLSETVWQVVHDFGPLRIDSIAARTGQPRKRVEATVYALAHSGMLNRGGRVHSRIYSANGDTYEDAMAYHRKLPAKKPKAAPVTPVRPVAEAAPMLSLAHLPPALQDLTLRELRTVYTVLKPWFE